MSHAIANPSPATAMRRLIARVWDDPDSRSTVIGVIGVILIHLFLFFVTPHFVRFDPSAAIVRPRDTSRQFNVELAPDTLAEPVWRSRGHAG